MLNQQFISHGDSYFLFGRLNKTHGIAAKVKSEVLDEKKKNGQEGDWQTLKGHFDKPNEFNWFCQSILRKDFTPEGDEVERFGELKSHK